MPATGTKFWTKRKLSAIDQLMMGAAILHPLAAIPQVIEIFSSQNAGSVSLGTWMGFLAIGLVFLTYGIAHKLVPFIVNQVIWFIVDLLVIVGILLYG